MSEFEPRTANGAAGQEMFFFERKDSDLPYYRGEPVLVSSAGWLIVLASVALAFTALIQLQPVFHSGLAGFIPALLFVLIPMGTLAVVAGTRALLALFRPIRASDVGLIILFFALNAVVTVVLGLIITRVFQTATNPAGDLVASADRLDQVLFFGWTAVQLLGEEIFTILPFLAFLAFLDRFVSRKVALCVSALGASIIFALIHLPTYQWNVAQALIGLVPIRIVLLLPFIITRNIWVSTGVHILNDWTIFGLGLIGAGAEAG